MSSVRYTAASLLACAVTYVSAHGVANGIVADGIYHTGFRQEFMYQSNPPKVVGWSTTHIDSGFVAPDAYTSSDIICHKGAKPAALSATVAAGGKVEVQWNTWPESHQGPILDYLAKCSGDCSSADKTALKFFKVQEGGLDAADKLMANNNTWVVNIPSDIAPGDYVLRHEIISLHSAAAEGGAQNYPQCFNLKITGSGTANPAGVAATALYTPTDPGILYNIFGNAGPYTIPGPALYNRGEGTAPAPITSATNAPISSSAASSNLPTQPSASPVVTTAPTQSSVIPPFQNGTDSVPTSIQQSVSTPNTATSTTSMLPTSTPKSACKPKTRKPISSKSSTSIESSATSVSPITSVSPTGSVPTSTMTVIPVPPAVTSAPTESTPTPPAPVVKNDVSELPEGTKLSAVLKWLSVFYTAKGDGEYVPNSSVKRRHARHIRP